MVLDAEETVAGDTTDGDGVEAPLSEDAEDLVFAAFLGDQQHALLRFGEHDLVGASCRLALGDRAEFDLDAGAGAAAHFAGGAGQAGGAHVLDADDGAGAHGFEAGFEEQLLHERIAHLDVGALLLGDSSVNSAEAIAAPWMPSRAGLGADVEDRVADAGGAAAEDLFVLKTPREKTLTSGLPS